MRRAISSPWIACVRVARSFTGRPSVTDRCGASSSCTEKGNFDPAMCMFAGEYCDFRTDFADFNDQAIQYYKYVDDPNPNNAEFVVESGAPAYANGTLNVYLHPPRPTTPPGRGIASIISTTRFMHYGVFEVTLEQTGHPGVVTTFISYSNDKDEIDLEITGADHNNTQANWYYRGIQDNNEFGASVNGFVGHTKEDNALIPHRYTMNWTENEITWSINGALMHKVTRANKTARFPSSPSRISFGVWQAQNGSVWAGNATITDWTAPIVARFYNIRAGPHGGTPAPPTHPPTGYNPDAVFATSPATRPVVPALVIALVVIVALW
ncbi:hypothetical protein PBRA_003760 [Plasmodiophora brassicae]|uniref:GH16 domain-containing protein n=1 Tax=Plasmodiophora brassicae TaxID=37360 RepID=A0A0G4IIL4_PLABS|nr:hypothetical protein PBRA_003760 [Plasmodiophora brassicae]